MKTNYFLIMMLSVLFFSACNQDRRTAQREGFGETEGDYLEGDEVENVLEEDTKEFLKEAASASMLEIQLAQLGMEKLNVEELQTFAERIIQEHKRINERLQRIAVEQNIDFPETLMEEHRQKLEELREAPAERVNDKFAELMVETHQSMVESFEDKLEENIKVPPVREWTQETIDVLREHLDRAKTLHEIYGENDL